MARIAQFNQKKKILAQFVKYLPWILFGVACIFIFILWFQIIALEHQNTNSPQQIASDTITAVGQLVVLPANETPTIATITDLAPLAGQPFFANAKVGDRVLIYAKAEKAILYDPSSDKIVEIAPIGNNAIGSSSSK